MGSLTPLRVSELVVIESLEDHEVKTGAILADYVSGLESVRALGIRVRLLGCSYSAEFANLIDSLAGEAEQGMTFPILHVECHGSAERGLEFANGSELSWASFGDCLRRLNAATGINLIVSVSACYGAHLLGVMPSTLPAPCLTSVGPIQEVDPSDLMAGFRLFYRTLFDTGDAGVAGRELRRSTELTGIWDVTHAEQWFELVTTNYIKDECTPKAVRQRAMALFHRAKREGRLLSMAEYKRQLVQSHRRDLQGRMFDLFFMLDEHPQHAMRFHRARTRLAEAIEALRATGRYVL